MTVTLTRGEYESRWREGFAGPTEALLPDTLKRFRAEHDGWDGGFWAMLPTPDGTMLEPINIRE